MSALAAIEPSPSFAEVRQYLNQIGLHLLKTDTPILSEPPFAPELLQLRRLNELLQTHNRRFFDKRRALYAEVERADLHSADGAQLLSRLKVGLNRQLGELDDSDTILGRGLRTAMTFDNGSQALEQEARLNFSDRLMTQDEVNLVESISKGPGFRPGMYALTFSHQSNTVEFAEAFVLTEKNSPVETSLTTAQPLGKVLLFTSSRGLESFSSLAALDAHLLQAMDIPSWRDEFMSMLPARYQSLEPAGIWPLQLLPIEGEPLFEHVYDARLAKRTADVDWALSLPGNVGRDSRQLLAALDRAVSAALPDFSPRLELRARMLLERCLRHSAPDWYRSASSQNRASLALHLTRYNQARQTLLDLYGPAATPQALARYQLIERLADELDIHDLDPDRLQIRTRRHVTDVGDYEAIHSLAQRALLGLHTGDELAGSDFLTRTTLTYANAPLAQAYDELTPAYLVSLIDHLQPRLDFAEVQIQAHARPEIKTAIEQMLDHRLNALAYTATLQNHITEADYQLIQTLRAATDAHLGAVTVSLHGAQLKDLWLLRQTDEHGVTQRLLLCVPEAPHTQQFYAFDSDVACQVHLLKWSEDPQMTEYLLERLALRHRPAMKKILAGLSFKPAEQEYKKVVLSPAVAHSACLKSMQEHLLSVQKDDYSSSTPGWYRSASSAQRRSLIALAENAAGAVKTYNSDPRSERSLPSFNVFLHTEAKSRLNKLLGRAQVDVDPDTVLAHYPPGVLTPPSVTYTRLVRDGYDNRVGFVNLDFETAATFTGPAGIDLSRLKPETVAASVRGWIGQRYIDLVKTTLQNSDSPSYDFRCTATLVINQLQMRNAALESRLKGSITQADLDWLDPCLKRLGETSLNERGRYQVHPLLIDGDLIIDNYLFTHVGNPVLLYTPDAPDGITFREARLFNYVLKKVDGMVGYFGDRVALQSQTRVRSFLTIARQQLPADIDRTTSSAPRYDSVGPHNRLLDLRIPFFSNKLQRKIDDVNATVANRTQMIMGIFWSVFELLTAIATAPFPVLSLSLGLLLAFKDGMLALHAYNQGDTSGALRHYVGYLLNSAGAVFTDLRPALATLPPLGKSLRHVPRKPHQASAMRLIRQLEAPPPAPEGVQAILFQGESLWAHPTPDALGRFLLYRHDPVSGQLLSTTRLVNQNADGQWVRSGMAGGAPKYEPLPKTDNPLEKYEVPQSLRQNFETMLRPDPFAPSDALDFLGEDVMTNLLQKELQPMRRAYREPLEQLTKDADVFFKDLPAVVPRASVLEFDQATSFAKILEGTAPESKGLIIGASPDSIASKQVLITHMHELKEAGFKRLYLEYLPADIFRVKLEKLKTAKTSRHIERHLGHVDTTLGASPGSPYSYRALMKAAREHGIEVRALDVSTSYNLDDALNLGPLPAMTPRSNTLRNYYSHKVLEADIAASPEDRWIALVDHTRISTYQQVPGLNDLQKTIGLRIEDVAPGQPTGIWADSPGSIPGDGLARADFKLTLETAYVPPVAPKAPSALKYSDFDLPEDAKAAVQPHLLDRGGKRDAFDFTYRDLNTPSSFFEVRQQLNNAAREFFTTTKLPPAVVLPEVTRDSTFRTFSADVYRNGNGLVIGEDHAAIAGKQLLGQDMQYLARDQQVRTLYLEHLLSDFHQADLDRLFSTQQLSSSLKNYLKSLDYRLGLKGDESFSALVSKATKYGVRVRALDCAASYRVSDAWASRPRMMSYFASQRILNDQASEGPHRWIALMGRTHANTIDDLSPAENIAGVARLTQAPSLHLEDVPTAQAASLHRDRGAHYQGFMFFNQAHTQTFFVQGDFKLDVAVPSRQVGSLINSVRLADPPAIETRLSQTGSFLIDRPSSTQILLKHRSRTEGIVTTPVQVDENGKFFIERASWPTVHRRPMDTVGQLVNALRDDVNLTFVK